MYLQNRMRTKHFQLKQSFCVIMAISMVFLLLSAKSITAEQEQSVQHAEQESVQHYKMLSTVEYSGKGQFKNQLEILLTVRKELLSDDNVRYFLSTNNFDLAGENQDPTQTPTFNELSFIIDRKTKLLSGESNGMTLFEKINNHCVLALKEVTKDNIGKTWKQSFNPSFLGESFPNEITFTLTATKANTKAHGELVAVRALSEPFGIKSTKENGNTGTIESRINAVYLFDPEIEDIYISVSVFEADTNINGHKEKLRHEVATYRTDAEGASFDYKGLDRKFEKFVRQVGLSNKTIKVKKEVSLPQWALSDGLHTAQVASIYAAMACEGAPNPVVTIVLPATKVVALQGVGTIASAGVNAAISSRLATSLDGVGAMQVAATPGFMGFGR